MPCHPIPNGFVCTNINRPVRDRDFWGVEVERAVGDWLPGWWRWRDWTFAVLWMLAYWSWSAISAVGLEREALDWITGL